MSGESVNELTSSLVALYNTGSYSDLTITCDGDEYNVHRAIICPRSNFFTVACTRPFKEAKTRVIDLPEEDPLAVRMMVMYFYHLDYNPHPESSSSPPANTSATSRARPSEHKIDLWESHERKKKILMAQTKAKPPAPKTPPCLSLHAKMYALGDKYEIAGLKKLAFEKFQHEIQYHWNSDEFPLAIQEVYTSTMEHDRPLRDEIVRCMTSHPSLFEKQDVQDLVKDVDLSFELLLHLRKMGRW